jgi:chromosome partitioning protein
MIVTVTHYKGGVGKTTAAMHIAAVLAQRGPTLLLDGDPNRSALGWLARGKGMPFAIHDQRHAARVLRDYDHVVIDTEARPNEDDLRTLAEGCDLLIVPTECDALSLQPVGQVVALFAQHKTTNYRVLLNAVPTQGGAAGDARAMLAEDGIPHFQTMIRRFAAYTTAANRGQLVYQTRDKKAKDAWSDFLALGEEIR